MSASAQQIQTHLTPEERLSRLMTIASKIEFIHGLDIRQYFRVMRSMICEVEMYLNTNEKEAAYVLASKFVTLYLEHLPKHREYASITGVEKSEWNKRCKNLLNKAEALKVELRARYEQEYESERMLLEKKTALEMEAAAQARLQQEKRASVMGTLVPKAPAAKLPDGNDRSVIANSLAHPSNEQHTDESFITPMHLPMLGPPLIDRSLKPSAAKSNAYGWSTVRLSFQLARRFLQLAEVDTQFNRETCGSLCGRVVGGEFHITDLVVPKQSGTSDSCTAYKEEELFEYVEQHNLMVLGWIHTHPTQTAFLSSVDLHTQLSYQIMLPEAIAIVCSPKFNDIQCFSLTPDYGIKLIRQCRQVGFHSHNHSSPLYEPSQHVVNDADVAYNVLDLR